MAKSIEKATQLSVRIERSPDFSETARLANEAFETDGPGFTQHRLQWLYDRAFSAGTDVLALDVAGRKIGQVALVHQIVSVGGREERAVALVDLFILKRFRSRDAIATLYGEVERLCMRDGIRFILAVPNGKAAGVNQRYLKLQPHLRLDIRAGLAWSVGKTRVRSTSVASLDQAAGLACLESFMPSAATGLRWTSERLWERLQDPAVHFGLHTSAELLLISSSRTSRRLSHTMLCAFYPKPAAIVTRGDVSALTSAACRFHRRPAFVYVGVNAPVPLPGWPLPDKLRPSPMVMQLRDLDPAAESARFDRFETLDFDLA